MVGAAPRTPLNFFNLKKLKSYAQRNFVLCRILRVTHIPKKIRGALKYTELKVGKPILLHFNIETIRALPQFANLAEALYRDYDASARKSYGKHAHLALLTRSGAHD